MTTLSRLQLLALLIQGRSVGFSSEAPWYVDSRVTKKMLELLYHAVQRSGAKVCDVDVLRYSTVLYSVQYS